MAFNSNQNELYLSIQKKYESEEFSEFINYQCASHGSEIVF